MKTFLQTHNSKINVIDIINPLLISIVLFLHHVSYTNNYFAPLYDFRINRLLQKFAVGGFFFFSGLKLSVSNINYSTWTFFKKRFTKIYFLYLTALILGSFTFYPFSNNGEYPSIETFIQHLFCLQTIFPTLFGFYKTIWFVSILFFCYLFFIFSRNDLNNSIVFILKTCTIFIFISSCYLITIKNSFQLFIGDFSIYVSFFAAGMFFSKLRLIDDKKYLHVANGAIGSLLLLIMYKTININTWYEYITYSFLVLSSNISLLYLLCIMLNKVHLNFSSNTIKLISKYSYGSFCVFLFHRSIWSLMSMCWPKGSFAQWVFIIVFGIPVIIILSFFIQLSYNQILQYCKTRLLHHRAKNYTR